MYIGQIWFRGLPRLTEWNKLSWLETPLLKNKEHHRGDIRLDLWYNSHQRGSDFEFDSLKKNKPLTPKWVLLEIAPWGKSASAMYCYAKSPVGIA